MTKRIPPDASFKRKNLHEQVVDELGMRIVRGDFDRDGSLPIEPDLSAELGISRNALREAIKVLASKGLVEVRPKTGMRVRAQEDWNVLDRDVLSWLSLGGTQLRRSRDLVEMRLIVEPKASYLAALRATAEEIEAIRTACTALEACVGHPSRIPEADIIFHRSIYNASHNVVLYHLGTLITPLMQMQVVVTTAPPGSFERGLPLHREVTEAIARREPKRAEALSRQLVEMPYEDLTERLHLEGADSLA
jgi:DNA-binding FadR family transcriptional regulator